jgi:hypothetical protein
MKYVYMMCEGGTPDWIISVILYQWKRLHSLTIPNDHTSLHSSGTMTWCQHLIVDQTRDMAVTQLKSMLPPTPTLPSTATSSSSLIVPYHIHDHISALYTPWMDASVLSTWFLPNLTHLDMSFGCWLTLPPGTVIAPYGTRNKKSVVVPPMSLSMSILQWIDLSNLSIGVFPPLRINLTLQSPNDTMQRFGHTDTVQASFHTYATPFICIHFFLLSISLFAIA